MNIMSLVNVHGELVWSFLKVTYFIETTFTTNPLIRMGNATLGIHFVYTTHCVDNCGVDANSEIYM